jgi:hypothetical protein
MSSRRYAPAPFAIRAHPAKAGTALPMIARHLLSRYRRRVNWTPRMRRLAGAPGRSRPCGLAYMRRVASRGRTAGAKSGCKRGFVRSAALKAIHDAIAGVLPIGWIIA